MDLGSGSTYSENMSAASGGPGGSQNQGPSGFGGGDSGGGNDVYSGYVAASQPRGGLQGIKDYFTGGGYDYGYQPTFAKTLGGIGNLLLGSINPVLGGLNFLRRNIGPEFDRFRQAPTLDRYFRPEAYIDKPYIIGTNPMDYQRFNPNQFGQEYKYRDGIASLNDIKNQFAYVTEQDIARRNMQLSEMQKTDYQSAKDIGLINPNMTEYEYNQLIQGNITEPGTYTA
jgi:hypothetical protein